MSSCVASRAGSVASPSSSSQLLLLLLLFASLLSGASCGVCCSFVAFILFSGTDLMEKWAQRGRQLGGGGGEFSCEPRRESCLVNHQSAFPLDAFVRWLSRRPTNDVGGQTQLGAAIWVMAII